MNIVVDFFWFKYNNLVKFNFDEKDKDGIEVFLEEKL
jgi:hypothetical protein